MQNKRSILSRFAVIALLVTGCAEPPPAPTQSVIHLDPRLADGRSSAAVLEGQREIVREWHFTSADRFEEERGGWKLLNGTVLPTREDATGVGLRLSEYDEARERTDTRLVLAGDLRAADVNAIEIDIVVQRNGSGVFRWVPQNPLESDQRQDFRLEAPFSGGQGLQTLRFPLDSVATWRGRLSSVDVSPVGDAAPYFELRAIRFLRVGYTYGAQPERLFHHAGGDGGLLGVHGDLRRVWPSDNGVPLFAEATLPAGARVTVDVTVPGESSFSNELTSVALDVRDENGVWHEIARKTLEKSAFGIPMKWSSLTGDAAPFAGQTVGVRLRSWRGADIPRMQARSVELHAIGLGVDALAAPDAEAGSNSAPLLSAAPQLDTSTLGLDGSLERTHIWWGSPMVLGQMHPDRRPNIVLVTLDTTRVDALGLYGGPQRTPNLDRLGAEGMVFEQAWSACNSTLPSHTSILTGLSVPVHGLVDNRSQLDPKVGTIAQALRAAGYHTAAAVSVVHLQADYSGLGRGFDHYLDMQENATVDGTSTIAGVKNWLDEWAVEGDRPFFLWVHLFDPHTPYGPDEEWLADYNQTYGLETPPEEIETGTIGNTHYTNRGEFLWNINNHAYVQYLYQAGVSFADELVGKLYGILERDGFAPSTALVITADHGESMGEGEGTNDIWYDHRFLYDPIMHVPLIVHAPGFRGGARIPERVSLIDLAPTLLTFAGVLPPADMGPFDDLFGPLADGPVHFVHSNTAQIGMKEANDTFFFNTREYLQLGKDLVTPDGHRWLFDSVADPMFRTNLAEQNQARAEQMYAETREWIKSRFQLGGTVRAEVSAKDEATLNQLGYAEE